MKKYYHVITERNDEYISAVAIAENIETVKAHFAGQNVREIIELNAAQVNTISAAAATTIIDLIKENKTMKTTLKDIRSYVTTNAAEDLTKKRFAEIDAIRVAECGFDTIAYSTGIYGVTGVLVKGNTTGKLYAVTARNSALFQVM